MRVEHEEDIFSEAMSEIKRLRAALMWFADEDKWLNEGRFPEWIGPGDEPWLEARKAAKER